MPELSAGASGIRIVDDFDVRSAQIGCATVVLIEFTGNGSRIPPPALGQARTPLRSSDPATFLLSTRIVQRNVRSVSSSAPPVQPLIANATLVASPLAPLVLVCDGDAVSRDVREAQLRTAGLRVVVARTGFEAIVKASCKMPDVILLDDSLMGIDAAETIRMLTTCPTTAHIPVVRLLRGRRLPQRMVSRLRRVAA